MVLPKRNIDTAIRVLRIIHKSHHITPRELANDADASVTAMYNILTYGDRPRPGSKNEAKILALVDRLKLEYPEDCPTKVIRK